MDALTYGSPVQLRHLTFSEARKMPIVEIHLEQALVGLGMTMEEVIPMSMTLDSTSANKGV